jgi:hypothetical protein
MRIDRLNFFALLNREKTAFDVEEELRFHIEMLESKYAQHGMPAGQARAAAVKRFGDFERVKQQCVNIKQRSSLVRRLLKISTILLALSGLAVNYLSVEYRVTRIGHLLIAIAIMVRLLLYVRGLGPSTFLPGTRKTVITDTPDDGPNPREA